MEGSKLKQKKHIKITQKLSFNKYLLQLSRIFTLYYFLSIKCVSFVIVNKRMLCTHKIVWFHSQTVYVFFSCSRNVTIIWGGGYNCYSLESKQLTTPDPISKPDLYCIITFQYLFYIIFFSSSIFKLLPEFSLVLF